MDKEKLVSLPDNGTRYWFVRVNPTSVKFEVKETTWEDFEMDRLRYAQGNFFTNEKDACDLAREQNGILSLMPPAKPGSKKYM